MVMFRALFGLVLAAIVTGQDLVEIDPPQAVVRIGDTFTVLCKVPYKIDSCRMKVGQLTYLLDETKQSDEDVTYFGNGIANGQCGARIKHVKEEWNGNISCQLPPQSGSIEVTKSMRLYVARAPADPDLLTPVQTNFIENEVFHAQCRVANGRPAAKIFWRLDDLPLDSRAIHEPITTQEPNSDLTTVSQNISYPLNADDNGRTLSCVTEHIGLDQPRQATRQISVQYMPKADPDQPITIFGLKLNEQGRLNVTVRANPEPRVEWTTGAIKLVDGSETEQGRLRALHPVALGRGYYEVSLVIDQLQKEDVERHYNLLVRNNLGELSRTVTISTADEPAGVELSTGAIVGIVIAVLILLAAISLAVFARATDRWCFSGRRETKNSGESTPAGDVLIDSGIPLAARNSDTESAGRTEPRAARGGRLAELGARVRAVLPRGKDKVATSDAQHEADDKPLSDEKKGVVYAELALGEQTNTEKPPPPSTEYAEIVYTDQQKQVKE